MVPTLLAGAGILVVAALMIFWPDDSTSPAKVDPRGDANAGSQSAAGGPGGVQARAADDARGSGPAHAPKYRVNPRLKPSTAFGMSPNPPSNEPPTFDDADEELAYWEMQLSEAKRILAMRERAIERLPRVREQLEKGSDPAAALAAFEKREKIVHENVGKQRDKVAELEEKVSALREVEGP
jgi:hypothetical protein